MFNQLKYLSIMEDIVALFIPIGMTVVLPIMIVWLNIRGKSHQIDKKTEIIVKAIENGQEIDPELFSEPKNARFGATKKMLVNRLQLGVIFSLIGIVFILCSLFDIIAVVTNLQILFGGILLALGFGFLVAFFVGKRMLAVEIAEEEKRIKNA